MKSCGSCNACCIAPRIEELGKDLGVPCPHLSGGHQGCTIYDQRPEACRTFTCGWLNTPEMPSRFRPDRCGVLLKVNRDQAVEVFEVGGEYEGSRLQRWLEPRTSREIRLVVRDGSLTR